MPMVTVCESVQNSRSDVMTSIVNFSYRHSFKHSTAQYTFQIISASLTRTIKPPKKEDKDSKNLNASLFTSC